MDDFISQRQWAIIWYIISDFAINGCLPSIFRDGDPQVVWKTSADPNGGVFYFGNVPNNPLDSIHVALG